MVTDRLGFVSLRVCLAILLEHRTLQNIQFNTLKLLFCLTLKKNQNKIKFKKKKKKSFNIYYLFIPFFLCVS